MRIIIGLSADDGEEDWQILICPFCHSFAPRNFQFDDYVDRPMLWCDKCPARSVLNLPILQVVVGIDPTTTPYQLTKIGTLLDIHRIDPTLDLSTIPDRPYIFYYTTLLFIERIISSRLSDYTTPQPIDESIVRQLIDSNYDPELCVQHGIVKRSDHFDPDGIDFNLSLTCASYNAELPKYPYPRNFELDHDGVYVYLQCRERDGRMVTIKYWGD